MTEAELKERLNDLPAVKVHWDAVNQVVIVACEPSELRNWDFVKAVLLMGAEQAANMAAMQRAAAAQQQSLRQALTGPAAADVDAVNSYIARQRRKLPN